MLPSLNVLMMLPRSLRETWGAKKKERITKRKKKKSDLPLRSGVAAGAGGGHAFRDFSNIAPNLSYLGIRFLHFLFGTRLAKPRSLISLSHSPTTGLTAPSAHSRLLSAPVCHAQFVAFSKSGARNEGLVLDVLQC